MAEESKTDEIEETGATEDESGAGEDVGEDDNEKFVFVEDPEFDLDYKGDCAYEVKVKIAHVNAEKKADEMYEELKEDVELPGFRRGRAPRKLIEKKFSKAVRAEVDGKLVSEAFDKLVGDEDLKPLGVPDVDGLEELKEREAGAALEFTLKFEVSPRVELGKYRGIEIERPVVQIDDKDVQEAIDQTRERSAYFEELEGGMAADGDQVTIDFEGLIDGEEFDGGKAENYPYILGSKRFFPEFEKTLLGSSPGDKLKCDVDFPDDYFAEALRGKRAQFELQVNEVKRKSVPDLDDDFAEQAGYESVEDMREKVSAELNKSAGNRSTQIAESRALDAVVEGSTYQIPKSVLERVAEDYYQNETRRLMEARVPLAQIEEREDELRAQSMLAAEKSIKCMVALNEIGEAEGVEVTEDDFEKEAAGLSASLGADYEKVAAFVSSDEQRGPFMGRIFRAKTLAIIMESANTSDKVLTRDEIANELDEEHKED